MTLPRLAILLGLVVVAALVAFLPDRTAVAVPTTGPSSFVADSSFRVPFKAARGIAVAPTGIAAVGDGRLVLLDLLGKQQRAWDVEGAPTAVAFAPEGTLLVASSNGVARYSGTGRRLAAWALPGDRPIPASIATTQQSVFVADAKNRCVLEFSPEGKLKRTIGSDRARHEFIVPSPYFDLLVTSSGDLTIVNPGKHAIETWGASDRPVASWGRNGPGDDAFVGCCNPCALAEYAPGVFVAAEKGSSRIRLFQDGCISSWVARQSDFDKGDRIADIAVDPDGRILVLMEEGGVIRRFKPTTAPSKN